MAMVRISIMDDGAYPLVELKSRNLALCIEPACTDEKAGIYSSATRWPVAEK